jgi:hypothetical protein
MHNLVIGLIFLIPTSLAVTFMLWVFWNLFKQSLRKPSR